MTKVQSQMGDYTVVALYHGGSYIDLYFTGTRYPFDAINVWDYVADAPTIEDTEDAVATALTQWALASGDALAHDLANYRESVR